MGVRVHPDALFQADATDGEQPHRHPSLQMERFDVYLTLGIHDATAPAVGVQRPHPLTVQQLGIRLGEYQNIVPARLDRRNQQAVIAPRQGPGEGAGGIRAEAVGQPPFVAFRQVQIAADGAAKPDLAGNVWSHGIASGTSRRCSCRLSLVDVCGGAKKRRARFEDEPYRHSGQQAGEAALVTERLYKAPPL